MLPLESQETKSPGQRKQITRAIQKGHIKTTGKLNQPRDISESKQFVTQ